MGAILGFIAFIVIIYLLAWLPGHIRQGQTKQLIEVGRAIKRESGFAGNTVILKFKCDNIAPLMQKLQSPHYLSASNVMMGEFNDSYYYIMSRDKPKWDADVTSKTNDDGTHELTLVFTKWKDTELDPAWGGNANECRTVIERTVLQIDPTAQIATRITKLKNSVLKGGAGMLSTGLHNLAADLQDDELKFTSLAAVYASAPPFQGGGPTVQAVVEAPQATPVMAPVVAPAVAPVTAPVAPVQHIVPPDPSSLAEASRAVNDPSTSGADLAAITRAQPALWAQIAAHPNAYPGLLDWLNNQGDATVKAVVAARQNTTGGAPTPNQ